ncbi:MAG: hypothetical protein ABEL51_07135 [Salinibacter sp.]
MQIPERPFDGEAPGDGAPSYEWLDEWLCEYVDGTMDPSLEAVFEQYVEANPELKAHVKRLRQTRELLCGCEVPDEALTDPTAEAAEEVEGEVLQSLPTLSESVHERPAVALSVVSSIAVALIVGFLAGSMLVDPDSFSSAPPVSTVERQAPSQTVRNEAPPQPGRAVSAGRTQGASFSTGESFVPRPASAPLSSPDTVGTSTALGRMGER